SQLIVFFPISPPLSLSAPCPLPVPPKAFFTSYLMLGLQLVAADLEQPFGYDPSDLKLDGVGAHAALGV
ncbi:unnamed protein product, partial [Discosporangium mesarthrocarpum]